MPPLTSGSCDEAASDCIPKRLVGRVDRVAAVENFERMRESLRDGSVRFCFWTQGYPAEPCHAYESPPNLETGPVFWVETIPIITSSPLRKLLPWEWLSHRLY